MNKLKFWWLARLSSWLGHRKLYKLSFFMHKVWYKLSIGEAPEVDYDTWKD